MIQLLPVLLASFPTAQPALVRHTPREALTSLRGGARDALGRGAGAFTANTSFGFADKDAFSSGLETWRQDSARVAVGVSGAVAESPEEEQCEISRQYLPAPTLCPMGNNRIPVPKMQEYIVGFKQVWAEFRAALPGPPCCMGINHQFAVYATVMELQPQVIIESGIAKGHNTWLLRRIAPTTPIFSVDPGDPAVQYKLAGGWKDPSGRTRYLTGGNFQDLSFARWDVLIPDPKVRERTLVILDDHQSSIERLKMLRHWGFRYAFYEDNYPFLIATSTDKSTCEHIRNMPRTFTKSLYGDGYSTNTVCAPVPQGWNFVLHKDRFGKKCKFLTLPEHQQNVQWMQTHLETYFEFPALFSSCSGLTRPTLLGNNPAALSAFGFPQPKDELWHYGHLYPALIELKPLSTVPEKIMFQGSMRDITEQQVELASAFDNIVAMYKELKAGTWWYQP